MPGISAVLILGIIALLFVGMYLYAISSNLIEDARGMRALKRKREKEEKLRQERIRKDEIRAEKRRAIERREREIKREFKWLEEFNDKINKKANAMDLHKDLIDD
jgi:uncharacterized membrane protein